MKKLLLLLFVLGSLAHAQTTIQFRRGNAADRPAGANAEPMFDRDSLMFWVYSSDSSAHIPIGGRYANFGILQYGVDSQGSDTYVITLPNFREAAYWPGMTIRFKANTINTGAATINVNGLGAKSITKNGTTTLDNGDISAGEVVTLVYDGTQFQLQGNSGGGNPGDNYFTVPNTVWLGAQSAASSSYTESKNDTIYVYAWYLPSAITLGKATVFTGSLTGTAPTRTCSWAVYKDDLTIADSTSPAAYVASDDFSASFVNNATVGPGLVYVAFSMYISTTGTFRFHSAQYTTSEFGGAVFGAQLTSRPIAGYAQESLTNGTTWPSSITLIKPAGTSHTAPFIMIWGNNID